MHTYRTQLRFPFLHYELSLLVAWGFIFHVAVSSRQRNQVNVVLTSLHGIKAIVDECMYSIVVRCIDNKLHNNIQKSTAEEYNHNNTNK